MKNIHLPSIIQKLKRRKNKIIIIDLLKKIISDVMGDEYTDKRSYKIIYYLKKKGRLVSLKKTIFYVKDPIHDFDEEQLIQEHYRSILHKHCTHVSNKNRYIGDFKALQLGFMDYSIPEMIHIISDSQQRQEVVLSEKSVQFKKYTTKGESLFKYFKKHTTRQKLGGVSISVADKELAVLEVLYSFDQFSSQYELEYLKKALKKYKHRDVSVREKILKLGKHNTSANRLYGILVQQKSKFAEPLLDAIKKYGYVVEV